MLVKGKSVPFWKLEVFVRGRGLCNATMLVNDVKEKDFYPWRGLTLTCVRILQLYAKVFQQDLQIIARIKEYVFLFTSGGGQIKI